MSKKQTDHMSIDHFLHNIYVEHNICSGLHANIFSKHAQSHAQTLKASQLLDTLYKKRHRAHNVCWRMHDVCPFCLTARRLHSHIVENECVSCSGASKASVCACVRFVQLEKCVINLIGSSLVHKELK